MMNSYTAMIEMRLSFSTRLAFLEKARDESPHNKEFWIRKIDNASAALKLFEDRYRASVSLADRETYVS